MDKVTQITFGFGKLGKDKDNLEIIKDALDSVLPGLRLLIKKTKKEEFCIEDYFYEMQIVGDSPRVLDGYDAAVFEAVCSLASENKTVFTSRQMTVRPS